MKLLKGLPWTWNRPSAKRVPYVWTEKMKQRSEARRRMTNRELQQADREAAHANPA